MVEEAVIRYLDLYAKDALKPPTREGIDVSVLRAEAKKLRERKAAQIRMHALGDLTDDDLATGMRTIRDRLSVVEAQIHASSGPDPIAEFRDQPAATVWKSLPLARKRALVKLLADVTLHPTARRGPGFDPDSVHVALKTAP
jgi:site-specific DNA recombinase